MKEEDGNTKFFHVVENGRRQENTIYLVKDEGTRIYIEKVKRKYFYNKFMEIFALVNSNSPSLSDWSSFFRDRPIISLEQLTTSFSMEEIRKATFQLDQDKAPAPDGFNLKFYQSF